MTPLSKIQFCIQYLRDTIHDVMPAREIEEQMTAAEYKDYLREEEATTGRE